MFLEKGIAIEFENATGISLISIPKDNGIVESSFCNNSSNDSIVYASCVW
jgi:hypothetical protein